jgi:hypothetical protein
LLSHPKYFLNIISVMQQWSDLLPAQERDRVTAIAEKIKKVPCVRIVLMFSVGDCEMMTEV